MDRVTLSTPSRQSPMPTGNGFGFATFDRGALRGFHPHPYRFARQNPRDPFADGPETPTLVKRLAWRGSKGAAEYRAQSQVIDAGDQHFFMPFGVERSVLVTYCDERRRLDVEWAHRKADERIETMAGRKVRVVTFTDISQTAALVPLGDRAFALLSVDDPKELPAAVEDLVRWQGGDPAEALADREVHDLDGWRATPPARLSADERKVWRQSETIMRMAQIREPGGHARGLIDASLPSGEWFIPWVRDMSYATVALARMGHQEEARRALDAWLEARPMGVNRDRVRGSDYQVSTVRYNGDGSEMADRSGLDNPNVELDSWGLALWAMGEYMRKYDDRAWLASPTWRGTVYENMRDHVARPLMENLDAYGDGLIVAADTSIWEQNDLPPLHYASSTITAIRGLRDFAAIAEKAGDAPTAAEVRKTVEKLERGFEQAFVRDGRIHGVLGDSPKNDVDAAALEAVNFGVVSDRSVVDATLSSMDVLAEPPGGWRRVTGDTPYEKHEFLWSDFEMARARLRLGQKEAAQGIVDRTTDRSVHDHGLIPEMYVSVPDDEFPGKIGDPTGAIPMVGYGAGLYTMYMLDREERG
jgi:hypothetical protein